jgi:hypothetical protein
MTVKLYSLALFGCALLSAQNKIIILSPTDGVDIVSPAAISASASGHEPMLLVFCVDGNHVASKKYSFSISQSVPLAAGSHMIEITGTYSHGDPIRKSVTVTVSALAPPPVSPPVSSPVAPPAAPPEPTNPAGQILNDMTGLNEALPQGVPSNWNFAIGPVLTMGNNAQGWSAIEAWGVMYVPVQGNPATNTRLNIRDMQTYFLSKSTNKWLLLQNTSKPDGANYLEDFSGDSNVPADVRTELDGSVSAKPGSGYVFHFYPSDRASINPNDIGGIVVTIEARLIADNPSQTDDSSIAKVLVGAGADYYPELTGSWPGNATFNPGVGNGKLKYAQTQWRSFSMTTCTLAQLIANPPPVDFSDILP